MLDCGYITYRFICMRKRRIGKVAVNGIEIYCEVHGSGEPLILIEGLGYSSWMWYKQLPVLSEDYQVIVFDNRGVGKTDKPEEEYSIEIMAEDAAGLLKTLGIDSAHVLGVSMGGFIAQELALRHPDMVRSLILVSTNMGSYNKPYVSPVFWGGFLKLWGFLPEILEASGKASVPVNNYGLSREEKIRYGLSLALSRKYFDAHPDEVEKIVQWRMDNPQPNYAWRNQLQAGIKFDSSGRVHEIKAPALVISGSEDRIIKPESTKELSEALEDSTFKPIEGAGHLLFIERSRKFNNTVLRFLDSQKDSAGGVPRGDTEEYSIWDKIASLFRNDKNQRTLN